MFKSAWDAALPVYAIGTALIFVFGSLLKTDERRSSVTLWGRSAQSQTPNKLHLPGKSRWRRTPFASVPIGTVYFDGQPNRSSSLIRCHDSFWAGSGQSAIGRRTADMQQGWSRRCGPSTFKRRNRERNYSSIHEVVRTNPSAFKVNR